MRKWVSEKANALKRGAKVEIPTDNILPRAIHTA